MFVSVDVGTSSVKVALINGRGSIIRSLTLDNPLSHPEPGAATHSPDYVVKLFYEGLHGVIRGYESRVEAVTLITYMGALGLLDNGFRVLRDAMTHVDARGIEEQYFLERWGRELYERTGCPPLFMYPLCKVLWLRRRNLLPQNSRLTFVKDYITYRVSGIHAVDYGVSSASGFLNAHTLRWDDLALTLAGVDESMLPEPVEGAKVLEYIRLPGLGISHRVALILGTFDGAAQSIGYSAYGGNAVLNLGSSTTVRLLTPDVVLDRDPRMRFFMYYAGDGYRAIGAASNNGMMVVDWFKSIIGRGDVRPVEGAVCRDGVYTLPFAVNEIFPFRNPWLTFTITGLRVTHSVGHAIRSLYEGVAFILRTSLNALSENGLEVEILHCGGGGCNDPDLVRVINNVLCKPIALHKDPRNAGVLGGAVLAMRALGYLRAIPEANLEDAQVITVVEPDRGLCEDYMECHKNFLKLINALQQR